jgi:hypothetical protein
MMLHNRNTITLSLAELALYQLGNWDAYHIETDIIELLDRHGITTPVVVKDTADRVVCGICPPSRNGRRV